MCLEERREHYIDFINNKIHTAVIKKLYSNEIGESFRLMLIDGDDDETIYFKKKVLIKKVVLDGLNEFEIGILPNFIFQFIDELPAESEFDDLSILKYPKKASNIIHLEVGLCLKTFFLKASTGTIIKPDIYTSTKIDWWCLEKSIDFFIQHGIIRSVFDSNVYTSCNNWLTKLTELVSILKKEESNIDDKS